jgi:hypothetical protein
MGPVALVDCAKGMRSAYPSDRHSTRRYRKGIAGSRVILQIMLEHNMVEVECPLCAETVDLGSDTTGTYECPYCTGDFEYKPIQRNFVIDWIFSSPRLVKIKISMLMFFFTVILYGIALLLGGRPCSGTGCYGGGP